MTVVTVFSCFAALGRPQQFATAEWTGDVPVTSAEEAFRFFNRVDFADVARLEACGYALPSLSVGDLVTIDGVTFMCQPLGFRELDELAVARVKADPYRACTGWLW